MDVLSATALEEEVEVLLPDWVREIQGRPIYSDARTWFEWLQVFTPTDVAEELGVDEATPLVTAAVWQGIVTQTTDQDGEEFIYEYVPLPPGPTSHFTRAPEWQIFPCGELAPRNRGEAVRLQKDDRQAMSTPGSRGRAKRREQRYEAILKAVAARKAKAKEKQAEEPAWRKKKSKSTQVVNF